MSRERRVTIDLSKFDGLLMNDAIELLQAYLFDPPDFLKSGVLLCCDLQTRRVFLVDDQLHIAMLNDGKVKQWATCQRCGAEEFIDGRFISDSLCGKCSETSNERKNHASKIQD